MRRARSPSSARITGSGDSGGRKPIGRWVPISGFGCLGDVLRLRLRLPFRCRLDHLADQLAALRRSRSLKSSPASGGCAIQTRRPSAWSRSAARSASLEAYALAIVVGEDDDALDLGRKRDLLQIARGQRRPDRQLGARLHHAKAGLDALAESDHAMLADLAQPHGAAGDRAQHHPRLRDVRFARAVRRQVGAVDGDALARGIAHDRDERRVAGARVPVGEIGVEQEVGRLGKAQPAAGEVGLACRARRAASPAPG